MRRKPEVSEPEIETAQKVWGDLTRAAIDSLRGVIKRFGISVLLGDVQYIDGRWYITHSGLIQIAQRRRCSGIRTSLVPKFCNSVTGRWVFRATVFKCPRSKGFVGYGAEMRVAETRAVNRALRKAYGIGLCSVEELGSFSAPQKLVTATAHSNGHPGSNCSRNGQPRLRDQLCVLIRQHNLDPSLVKAYAADFCGTATLKEASRDLVETFVSTLADEAAKDRAALVCKLNSYTPQPEEVNS
jgi:hypothetical protein